MEAKADAGGTGIRPVSVVLDPVDSRKRLKEWKWKTKRPNARSSPGRIEWCDARPGPNRRNPANK